jgi:hypothetical protein
LSIKITSNWSETQWRKSSQQVLSYHQGCHVYSSSLAVVVARLFITTPVTIVTCACASWDSPGLHCLADFLPYICHSFWFFPQVFIDSVPIFYVCTYSRFVTLFIKFTLCTCFPILSELITKAKGGYFEVYKIYLDFFRTFSVTTWFHFCYFVVLQCQNKEIP